MFFLLLLKPNGLVVESRDNVSGKSGYVLEIAAVDSLCLLPGLLVDAEPNREHASELVEKRTERGWRERNENDGFRCKSTRAKHIQPWTPWP